MWVAQTTRTLHQKPKYREHSYALALDAEMLFLRSHASISAQWTEHHGRLMPTRGVHGGFPSTNGTRAIEVTSFHVLGPWTSTLLRTISIDHLTT